MSDTTTFQPLPYNPVPPAQPPSAASQATGMEQWLGQRYDAIQGDHHLDTLMQPQFDQAAATNPIVAANGSMVGDVWRTVKMLGGVGTAQAAEAPAKSATPKISAAEAGNIADTEALKWLTQDSAPVAPPAEPGPLDAAYKVAKGIPKTVAANVLDAVAQIPFGAYTGVKNALDAIDGLTSLAADKLGNATGIQVLKDYAKGGLGLPDAPAPSTSAGMVTGAVAQFLTGYAIGGKLLEGLSAASGAGTAAKVLTQGAIADGVFFSGQQGKLADLVNMVPALKNPVSDYLATDPNDTEAEGRFKNVLNGIIAAPLVPIFAAAVRGVKYGTEAIRSKPVSGQVANAAGEALGAPAKPPVSLLGDTAPGAPLTVNSSAAATAANRGQAAVAEALGQVADVPGDQLAKSLTDRGLQKLGDGSVYVNFARINTSEDVKRIIQDVSTATKPMIDTATGGPQSLAGVAASAGEVDAFNVLMARRQGVPLAPAEITAARQLHAAAAEKLQQLAQAVLTSPVSEAPQRILELRQMFATFAAVNAELRGASADASRALGAWRINVKGSFRANQIESMVNQAGGIDVNRDLAQKIVSVASDPAALDKFAEPSWGAKTKDAINAWFYAFVLSSPMTHIKNTVGNATMLPLTMSEHAMAARIAGILGDQASMPVGQAAAQWTGTKMAFRDAVVAAKKAFVTGQSDGGYGLNKMDSGTRPNAISSDTWKLRQDSLPGRAVDALGAVLRQPGNALVAEDQFFRTTGASASGYQQAFVEAQQALARGEITPDQVADRIIQHVSDFPNNLTDSMRAKAAQQQAYMTFNDPPTPGGMVDTMLKLRAIGDVPDASLGQQIAGQFVRMTLPFVNFAGNAMKTSFERTPLAPLSARYRDAMRAGGAAAYTANARMSLGTMMMSTFVDMAMNGDVSGQGPSDPAAIATLKLTGWQPYSVKIGDHWYSYNNLQPLSTSLGWAANIGEMLSNSNMSDATAPVNIQKVVTGATFAIADQVLSTSFMSQSANLIGALQDKSGSKADTFIKQMIGSLMVPNASRYAEQLVDPVQRYTTNSIEEARSRIPGLSTTLPPRRDALGFQKDFSSGLGKVYDAISPFYASQVKDMPIASAMIKDGWGIGMPPMAFSINPDGTPGSGERVDVREQPAIYSRFLELRGQIKPSGLLTGVKPVTNPDGSVVDNYYLGGGAAEDQQQKIADTYGDHNMTEALNGIVSDNPPPELADLAAQYHDAADPAERQKIIRGVMNDYGDAAKAVLFNEYPELMDRAAKLKAAGSELLQ